jgi:segregation and condensation protein B
MSDTLNQTIRIIEALLFASVSPLSVKELHERMSEGADVGGALLALKAHYEGRGVQLVEMDGQWAFRTAADLADSLSLEKEVTKKLSRAGLETLAIIAYHQPITRAEVENIRGVATHRGTLDSLIEAGWVKPGRRRETPGRPLTWVTTGDFLDQFNLESIMELPGLDDLKASGLLDRRPAIDAIPGTMVDDTPDLFSGQDSDEGVEDEADEERYLEDVLEDAEELM